MKILTITIPSYNVSKFLPEVLPTYFDKSVIDDFELLIVDDGSKDDTAEIASKYVEKYPNTVRLIQKENGGHGSTINAGIAAAVGKYFRVIDGDDWVDTKEFTRYVEELKSTDADAVLTECNLVYEDTGKTERLTFDELRNTENIPLDNIIGRKELDVYSMHMLTIKTEIARKIPKILEHCFYVDVEFILYVFPYIQTVKIMDACVYQYRLGNPNQSMSFQNLWKNKAMYEKVFQNVVAFYNRQSDMPSERKTWLARRIGVLCNTYIEILLYADQKSARDELEAFLKYIKDSEPVVYELIPGRKARYLKFSTELFYYPISRNFRKKISG